MADKTEKEVANAPVAQFDEKVPHYEPDHADATARRQSIGGNIIENPLSVSHPIPIPSTSIASHKSALAIA